MLGSDEWILDSGRLEQVGRLVAVRIKIQQARHSKDGFRLFENRIILINTIRDIKANPRKVEGAVDRS